MRRSGLAALPLWLSLLTVGLLVSGCKPTYPNCKGDGDCQTGEFCVNAKCQQCRVDADCHGGRCNAGRCEAVHESAALIKCTRDDQCPLGQSCVGGVCRPCTSDAECGEGGRCHDGRCDRRPGPGSTNKLPAAPNCQLVPVYFDFNEYVLSTEATQAIDVNAECIKRGRRAVNLTGHSDERGTEEYNLALSDKRALAVKERLVRMGVATEVRTLARGELDATGHDEAGWAKDRRVDPSW